MDWPVSVQARTPSYRDRFAHLFASMFAASFVLMFSESASLKFFSTFLE